MKNPFLSKKKTEWIADLGSREDLKQFGDTALGLFALALRFDIDDLETVAADAITDGPDDKKCDLVFVEPERRFAVVAQCYKSSKAKSEAPANKAADLNTAVGWLLRRPLKEVPEKLRPAASNLRDALSNGKIDTLFLWYVHNLPQSKNVSNELSTVSLTAKGALESKGLSAKKVTLHVAEIGSETFIEWYAESKSPMLVTDKESIQIPFGFEIKGIDWKGYVTALPGKTIAEWHKKHKRKLFSANVRDYLGSRQSDTNINNAIASTAQEEPQHFWVYNNGLTILTASIEERSEGTYRYLDIEGLSIVNGAQTTGALGSLTKLPSRKVLAGW